MDLKIEQLPVEALTPYAHNTRAHHAEDVGQIARSIERYGFNDPIAVWSDKNIIVEGHGRLMAAKSLGMTTVPVIRLDHLTDDQRREYGIMHNKTAELSDWDWEQLEHELSEVDLSEFGLTFTPEQIEDTEEELLEAVQEDEVPEPPNNDPEKGDIRQPRVHRGEIWQLGQHRLMCGDSTSEADVAALMDGQQADAVVTDPPYNVAIENSDGKTIQNDDMSADDFRAFLRDAFKRLAAHLKPGGAFYVWHASRTQAAFEAALNEAGLEVREQLIWVKNVLVLGRQDYHWRHEPCFYGWADGAAHWFTPDRTQTTVQEDKPDFGSMSKAELVALLEQQYKGDDGPPSTAIFEKKPLADAEHPTMKPVRLIARLIRNSTRPGETVLDLFGGSGTTMIAAEQLGRKACLMELDERYADVIIERYEKFTGKKAQRIR